MSRNSKQKTSLFSKFFYAWKEEYRFIFKDGAVIFSMLFISIVVAFVYTYLYSHEVLEDLPLAIVDNNQTTESRTFARMLDATPQVAITYNVANFSDAERLFDMGKAKGIVVIPGDFGKDLIRGAQPVVSVYADASYILYYKQVFKAANLAVNYMNAGIEVKKAKARGSTTAEAMQQLTPVQGKVVGLYNPDSGYATFVMPAVYLIILQTTMLTGIGLLGGTFREHKRYADAHNEVHNIFDGIALVLGKSLAYASIGAFVYTVILGFVLPLFAIPQRGSVLDLYVFILPYLLSIAFLGITLNRFFRHREDAVMTIIFTSIPALLLCGVSWPIKDIPSILLGASKLLPSTIATKGFVAISQAGSCLAEVRDVWLHMWILCGFYFLLSILTMRRLLKK